MDRISTATKAPDLYGAGKHGFRDGDLGAGIPPTDLNAAWFNGAQEELVGVIEAAGVVPAAGDLTQVRKAIETLISRQGLGQITAAVAANALTVTLQPFTLAFRASVLNSGAINVRTLAAASALVVPTGATLGTVANQQARLIVLALDNNGVIEPAIVNLAGGLNLDESGVISTTAIGAASNSAGVVYSQAARANVPYRVRGCVDITQAVAGTWATAPTLVQGAGGAALAALQSFGVGQTWQNLTGSRAGSTTYYNTTGRTIWVRIVFTLTSTAGACAASPAVAGASLSSWTSYAPAAGQYGADMFPVGPGQSYAVTFTNVSTYQWLELR
jgi:hypothetical protein